MRNIISYIPQETIVFRHSSLIENVRLSKSRASKRDAIRALSKSNFIAKIEDQLHSKVLSSLSGGEKNRLSIARSFLRESSILIIDEPTSALDAKAKYEVLGQLRSLAVNKTVILITHSLHIIKDVDKILFLDTLSCGSHDQLMKEDELYRENYELNCQAAYSNFWSRCVS